VAGLDEEASGELAIDADVAAALGGLGLVAEHASPITGTGTSAVRTTLRIRTRDGRIVKARRSSRPERAEAIARIVAEAAGLRLPKVLAHAGRITIEEWIEGVPLDRLALDRTRLEHAADLLAGLHRLRPVESTTTAGLVADLLGRLTVLAAAGVVLADEEETLASRIRSSGAPQHAATGVVHGDFSAANLVEDGSGELWAVDVGGLRAGFLDLDLARSRLRWPMNDRTFATFLARSRRSRPEALAAGEEPFWLAAAAVRSAHFRTTRGLDGAREAIDRLAAVAGPPIPAR
jgi:aminoglycoside phosphotransferase